MCVCVCVCVCMCRKYWHTQVLSMWNKIIENPTFWYAEFIEMYQICCHKYSLTCSVHIIYEVPNCDQNIFCKTSTFLEQPLLLYVIVTVVWSGCNIFVYRELVHLYYITCKNTDITWYYVLPQNSHIVVSVWCTLLVPKSQCMQELVYNYSTRKASVAVEVQILALWVIKCLWLIIPRQERHFVTTRSLTVACIRAEATTSSQTWWS
jgi:hypothetical protein